MHLHFLSYSSYFWYTVHIVKMIELGSAVNHSKDAFIKEAFCVNDTVKSPNAVRNSTRSRKLTDKLFHYQLERDDRKRKKTVVSLIFNCI